MSQGLPPTLHLKVITARRLLVDAEVDEVALPGLDGQIGILPGHRALIAGIGKGILAYRRTRREDQFAVQGGYAEIQPDAVLVFTELSEDEDNTP
jgi:F-type H+-transporting ATPase subunit epsilon